MLTLLPLPYIQAAGDGGPRTVTQLIVIHATDNTASDTAEASYATHRPDQTSCHVVVDDDSAVQINRLDHVAFGCFPTGNARSIQFELCGLSNQLTAATIARAAQLVAAVAQSWGIPAVRPSVDQMRAGAKGIVGHVDVTNAWHEGDHTDPGPLFPWADFLRQVQAAMATNQPTEDHMTAHLWRGTDGKLYYVTGPLQFKRVVSPAEADTIRYYAKGPGLPGFTLVDLVGSAPVDTDPAVIPGVDVTHLATAGVDTLPIVAAIAAVHTETEQMRDALTAAGRALAG